MRSDVRVQGTWPEPVSLRRGWASARARPWNDHTVATASLRLERGSDKFVIGCCEWLADQGVQQVLSPALNDGQTHVWRRAGFDDHLYLVVYERSLSQAVPPPDQAVIELTDPDLDLLAGIDDRAFHPTWRVGRNGLQDAIHATPWSSTMAVVEDRTPLGFVIVGETGGVAYLQRLAVDPDVTGRGIGRSLVRASIAWARTRGGRSMLLNTQPENAAAARLYTSEDFVLQKPRLRVLAKN